MHCSQVNNCAQNGSSKGRFFWGNWIDNYISNFNNLCLNVIFCWTKNINWLTSLHFWWYALTVYLFSEKLNYRKVMYNDFHSDGLGVTWTNQPYIYSCFYIQWTLSGFQILVELWWRRCLILISSSVVLLSWAAWFCTGAVAWQYGGAAAVGGGRDNWLVLWLRGNWTDNVHFQIQIAAACYVLRCIWYCWGKLSASEMVILRNTVPNSQLYSAFRGSSLLDPKFPQLAKNQTTRQLPCSLLRMPYTAPTWQPPPRIVDDWGHVKVAAKIQRVKEISLLLITAELD